ncbi:speckle-type POZ protein-like [Denticeps clupeoides]|uniref:speckle-type POZ protein-like n=1 Tax=Denticeps clupeoides TaxID=299321 RepID=UPI0010A3AD55|nr:speckle-type POZ protein-like [Denticeps clupeoides]
MTSITCYTQCKAERFSLTWTITNFSFAEGCVESSFFTNAREQLKWSLFLSTNGVGFQNERCLSFYINLVSGPETGVRCKGRMAILNSKGEEAISRDTGRVESLMEGFAIGLPNFARWDDIMAEEAGILQDDTLTLTCEIHVLCRPENTQLQQVKVPECRMAEELGDLWDQSLLPDCSLVVGGQEFQAHKAILAARCPVFRAMFLHDMKERRTNRVEIQGVEPEVLKELVTFIYTGKAPNLQDMATDLLVAADMYLLERLKRMCEDALCRSLTVENSVDILIFTDLHLTPDLKEEAITFIKSHFFDIIETPGWESLRTEHPHLIGEVNRALFSVGAPAKRPCRTIH